MGVQENTEEKLQDVPEPLSPKFKDSFAYPTLKDRVPTIICKVIDLLYRNRNKFTQTEQDELKAIIEQMSKLRYELVTNKPLTVLEENENSDGKVWNDYLKADEQRLGVEPRWFETTWMYSECYAYRRLIEATKLSQTLRTHDYFGTQKREAFEQSSSAISGLISGLEKVLAKGDESNPTQLKADFEAFFKICLWGNKCDLSISGGVSNGFEGDASQIVSCFAPNLIVDDTEAIWSRLNQKSEVDNDGDIVDFVLDNAAFEFVSDLCLADFIVSSGLAKKVRFRGKAGPWFVSDVTAQDVEFTFEQIAKSNPSTAEKWSKFRETGIWSFHFDPFWTYPHDFSQMKAADPSLYKTLSEAKLVIFKGDLNHRKLLGDLSWKPTDDFNRALQGFHPAPLVTLRTIKADLVTGLRPGQAEQIAAQDPNWMVNGNWAVIQFSSLIL